MIIVYVETLCKSHVRESLSPHQDKIQFSKSPNHYPDNTGAAAVHKSIFWRMTIFKLDTISHPYHLNCALQTLLWRTNNFVINHEDLLVLTNLWLIHQRLTKMVTKHTDLYDLCFFYCFIRVSETQSSEICTFHFDVVFVAEAAIQDHLKVLHPENGLNKTWAT